MWFDPFSVDTKSDFIANSANYQSDFTSQCLEISSEVVSENKAPDLAELARLAESPDNQAFVSCGKCLGFKCHNLHGQGSGYCLVGGDYGLWSETEHHCQKFDARIEIQDYVIQEGAITVTCYTPNGQAFEVEARDSEHAKWLQKMNPKRV